MKRRLILVIIVVIILSGGLCMSLFSRDYISVGSVSDDAIVVVVDSLVTETTVDSNDIIVEANNICELDEFTTFWNLDSAQIVRYVETRYRIDSTQACEIINKNYHPFCIETYVVEHGCDEYLLITPSGVGISYKPGTKKDEFYMTTDSSFILSPRDYERNWRVKILSKQKFCDEIVEAPVNDELYQWFLKWELTVTQMNEYFDLCEWIGSYRLNGFGNIPCRFSGYALFQNKFYFYRLECSGGSFFRELNGAWNDEEAGFGCYDKRGEKYIYEISLSSDS